MTSNTLSLNARLQQQLEALHEQGLFKHERALASPQQAVIEDAEGQRAINLCANNYLGLSLIHI